MPRGRIATRSAATAATANIQGAVFWNQDANRRIVLREVHWFKTVATGDNIGILRASARGTATTTATPAVDNADERDLAPPAGLLDTAWSVAPTIVTASPYNWRTNLPAAIGAGFILPIAIAVPPGTGIAIVTPVATILQPGDVTFVFDY